MFIDSPKILYKFGKTMSSDIMERFSVEHHEKLNWRGIALGRDYNIRPIWSMWVPKVRAVIAEDWFSRTYPKKFFCTNEYNGITECRNWTKQEHTDFRDLLYNKYPATDEYKAEIKRLKMEGRITDTHEKVYYIMLTKKQ